GFCDEPYDAGLVVIDLVARVVAIDSTYSSPGRSDSVKYHNSESCTDIGLSYHLAADWLFVSDADTWQAVSAERRRKRAATPPLDARAVFYGKPLLEFLV